MAKQQKAIFFLYSGIILLMGTLGGVDVCPDLATYDGIYLGAFALAGIALMAIGASYSIQD